MNKTLKKVIALAASAVLCVGMLSACGTKNTTSTDADTTAETTASEKIIMGTNAEFPPFEYTAANGLVGEFDGIDIAIAQHIAENAGATLEISDMEFDGLIAAVSTGKVDFAIAGMTVTEERQQNVDFSDPYYVAEQVIVVASDNEDITSAEDIKDGKKVGVVLGFTADSIVTDDLEISESNIVRGSRGIDIVQDVKNGKLDAVVIDSYTGKQLAEKNGLKVIEDSEAFGSEEYAIAVQKGNTELLEIINATLAELKESGEIERLAEEYGNSEEIDEEADNTAENTAEEDAAEDEAAE